MPVGNGFATLPADALGDLDVLVNNAGGGLSIKPIEAQSKETIDAIVALNLNSVMYAANVFAPQMKARKSGTIINIASVCATHAWADWSVYAAAKAGVRNFTKGLQVELQPYGVRATCIIPGVGQHRLPGPRPGSAKRRTPWPRKT